MSFLHEEYGTDAEIYRKPFSNEVIADCGDPRAHEVLVACGFVKKTLPPQYVWHQLPDGLSEEEQAQRGDPHREPPPGPGLQRERRRGPGLRGSRRRRTRRDPATPDQRRGHVVLADRRPGRATGTPGRLSPGRACGSLHLRPPQPLGAPVITRRTRRPQPIAPLAPRNGTALCLLHAPAHPRPPPAPTSCCT